MNDACTVCHGNIGVAGDIMTLFVLLFANRLYTIEKRLIFFIFKLAALIFFYYFISRSIFRRKLAQNLIKQSLCYIVGIAVCRLYLAVGFVGVYAERNVRGKRPRSGCPCKEIGVLAHNLEADYRTAFFNAFIALSHFVRGKRSSAAGAVGNYLKALIKKTLFVNLFKRPPFGLYKIIVIGDIGVFHIRPKADGF